ncbi:MAG: YeeE/YedE family protein, partial [Mesorhizobium sp.]|nr:YeeE/YedE family protein [Mesorhizobium sp.]
MTNINATLARPPAVNLDKGPVVFVGLAFVLGTLAIGQAISPRQALLFLIGGLLGMTLYHASFGFTGGWRRFVVERRGRALRAQMLMIAVAAVVFIPLLAMGSVNGLALAGAFAPVGVS